MRTMLRSKVTLLFLAFAVMLAVGGTAMALTTDGSGTTTSVSPTISSDKADYAPGELVTLTGSNWQPGESVHIVVNDTYGATWKHDVYVDADASGNITDQFNLPDSFVSDYDVTATGSSGTATTSFTDGNVTYSPTRLPATGLQAVTAGNSVDLAPAVTLTKTGGGADPVVNTPFTVTNKTTGSLTGQTCGGAGTAIPSSWLSVASPTLPQTITTSQNVTFRVSPPANASAGTYTGAVELANSTTNNTNAVDVCLNVSAAPTAVNTTTTASSTTATYGNSSATLNANVSPASGPAVGSGTVTFTVKKGATTIGTVTSGTVSAGSASANFPLSGVNADTYTIEAAYNAGTGFNASNNSTQSPAPTLTVGKANTTTTVSCPTSPVTYTGNPIEPCSASVSGPGLTNQSVPVTYTANTDAGTATAKATYAGTTNLEGSTDTKTFEIGKATAQVTLGNLGPHVYDGTAKAATVTTAPAGLNVVNVTYDGSATAPTAVGSYNVVATLNNPNYQGQATGTLVISPWTTKGFYQPIDMGDVLNTVKNGSTVPVKFELFSGTTELTSTSAVSSIVAKTVNCAAFNGDPEDAIETLATGGTSLRYDATGGQFIYNWQTPKKINTCYNLTMTATDGSTITAYFKLK
jgi:hypothetical protein